MKKLTLGETLVFLRNMVDSFVCEHGIAWDKVRDSYQKEHGFPLGVPLSMQSFLGSDLLIDLAYLAADAEKGEPFSREYWVRSQGTQCIRNEEDFAANNPVWSDVVAKIRLNFDGKMFDEPEWFEDEKCRINNKFIKEGIPFRRYF